MPTIKVSQFRTRQYGAGSPFGNEAVLAFGLATNAAGAVVNSDTATGVALGDKIVIGSLPAGMRLDDAQVVVSVPMTALVTGSLGFEYEDGVDVPAVPQNAAYFGAGLALNAAGRLRDTTANAVVTLPKPASLILTTAGAANAKASALDVTVWGEFLGQK